MIESFLVYGGLMVVMILLGFTSINYYKKSGTYSLNLYLGFICLAVLIFATVFGARYNVGIDHLSYLSIYQEYGKGYEVRDTFEPGFVWINKFYTGLGLHFFFYFFTFALLQILFIVLALQRWKETIPFVFFVLMCGPFMGWMNIMRQEIVVCIFIWLIMTIEKRNFLNYTLWIIACAFFFHKSAIILIPLYPLIKSGRNYSGPVKFQLIIFSICLFMGYTHFILTKLEGVAQLAVLIGYGENYGDIDNFDVFFKHDYNWGIRSWLNILLIYFTILISNTVKDYYKDKSVVSLYTLFFWGSCCSTVTMGIDVIGRIFTYFSGLAFVVYGLSLYLLWRKRKESQKVMLRYLGYTLLNLLVFFGTLYGAAEADSSAQFQFFWQV